MTGRDKSIIMNENDRELLININSAFRPYVKGEQQPANNFLVTLPDPIKHVKSLRLNTFQSPDSEYTITNKNNTFYIILNNINYLIDVKPGRYGFGKEDVLVNEVNKEIQKYAPLADVIFGYDEELMKFFFAMKNSKQPPLFEINFDGQENKNKYVDQTFGWTVGFRKSYYSNKQEYLKVMNEKCKKNEGNVGGVTYDKYDEVYLFLADMVIILPNVSKYYLLSVEDFQKSSENIYVEGVFPDKNTNDLDIIEKIPSRFVQLVSSTIENPFEVSLPRIYVQPVTLSRFRIKLYNDKNELVDLNNQDYSFTLKLIIKG